MVKVERESDGEGRGREEDLEGEVRGKNNKI